MLLCFDGSDDAAHAIVRAGELLGPRNAVVVSVWEPVAVWEPYDPATILAAPAGKLASRALGLDEIAEVSTNEMMKRGIAVAQKAGFVAEGRTARGKPWRAICELARDIDAGLIILGARGLSRAASVLLGSVSSAVLLHAKRPVLVIPHSES